MNFKAVIHKIIVMVQHGQGIPYRDIWMDFPQNTASEEGTWSARNMEQQRN